MTMLKAKENEDNEMSSIIYITMNQYHLFMRVCVCVSNNNI
jgi:hypothetical protein